MATVPLPDGSEVKIREGETEESAWNRAKQMYPEAFGIQQQHGFIAATKAGGKEYIGAGIRGLGNVVGSEGMEKYGKEVMAPDETPGAYHEVTDEEQSAAYKRGILPGLNKSFQKYVSEPVGGMVGRYAIPTIAGAATAAALAGSAPVSAVGGLGAAGVRAVLSGAGFTATDFPAEQGENIQRQEQVTEATPVGQPLPQFDQTNTIMSSLVQAALMPVLGGVGGKVTHGILNLMGPEIAATTKAVASGQMTKEAAIASLNSTAKNMLVKSGEMTAVGIPMMTGTEALRRGQAGQEVTGDEANQAYWDQTKAALSFAPIGALMGIPGRRGQVKAIEGADKYWQGAEARAADMGGDRATYEAKMQKNLAGVEDTTRALDLGAPEQPTGKDVYRAPAAESAEAPAPKDTGPVLGTKLFDDLKIKGNLRAAYEGMPLDHPDVAIFIQTLRDKAEKTKSGEVATRLSEGADAIDLAVGNFKKAQERTPEQQRQEEFRSQAKQGDLGIVPFEESRAQNMQAEMSADAAAYRAKQPPTELNAQRDMFTGKQEAVDMSAPRREPVVGHEEFNARNEALYGEFQKAHEEYQKTGDSTRLNDVLAQAKEELGPMNDRLNQASTQKMFDKRGKPTRGATAYEQKATTDQGAGGTGIPLPIPTAANASRARPITKRVPPPKPVVERPVVGEKPVKPALTTEAVAEPVQPALRAPVAAKKPGKNAIQPEVTEKAAGKTWEVERDNSPDFPAFKELHLDAKDALQAKMELSGGRLTGQIMKEVRRTHKDAVRREGIREELSAGAGDEHLYRKGEEGPQPTHTKAEAEAMVNNIKAKWKNAPEIHVVETKELSESAQADVKNNNAQGFIDKNGAIVILSDRNANLHEVKATLFHEALGHHGLRREFREGLSQLLRDIHDTNPEIRKLTDAYKRDNPKASHELAIEEVLAEKQIEGRVPQGVLGRLAAYVRSFLRKIGLVTEYSNNDVKSVLRRAHDAMVTGEKPVAAEGEWAARSKQKSEAPFSKSIPNNAKIMLEDVTGEHEVKARATMRAAERKVNVLEKLLECMGHA